jgi:hypothetical protein
LKIKNGVIDIDKKFATLQKETENIYGRKREPTVDLNADLNRMKTDWNSVKPKIGDAIEENTTALSADFNRVRLAMSELLAGTTTSQNTRPLILKVKSAIQVFQAEVQKREHMINEEFLYIWNEQLEFEERITTYKLYVNSLFTLMKGETLIAAVKAKYNDAAGDLFLTNKRLIFEQNEFVADKRIWVVIQSGERKLVHLCLLEKQLHEIKIVRPHKERKALILNDYCLYFEFAGGVEQRAQIHLSGKDYIAWAQKIQKAKAGEDQKLKNS